MSNTPFLNVHKKDKLEDEESGFYTELLMGLLRPPNTSKIDNKKNYHLKSG